MRSLGDYGQRLAAGLRGVKPGSLILCDTFAGPDAHGKWAAQVARQEGFQGPLVAVNFEDPQDTGFIRGQDQLAQHVQGWGEAQDGAAVRKHLYEAMVQTRVNLLSTATDRLLAVAAAGARQVALNLSLGSTPAMCVTAVLDMCASPEIGEQAQAQLAKAFGGEAKAGLVATAAATSKDERLLAARAEFAASVALLEEGHNSVVVAAGNDGNVASRLGCAVPEGFTRSDFVTPDVTVVGALEEGERAAYTGDPSSVVVWASGQAAPGVHGTSFAAPRVATAFARLHGEDAGLTSREAEAGVRSERHKA